MENLYVKTILALETGLSGGSVSILKNGRQIGWAVGARELSKSEDMLLLIENLLKKNGIEKREIGIIAVSDGPGSLTGLRIGLAIARGLGDSLSAKVCRISVLETLACQSNLDGRVLSAIYTERIGIFYQEFLINAQQCKPFSEIVQISKLAEFADKLDSLKGEGVTVVLNENLRKILFNQSFKLDGLTIFLAEGNLAETIGLAVTAKCI